MMAAGLMPYKNDDQCFFGFLLRNNDTSIHYIYTLSSSVMKERGVLKRVKVIGAW